MAHAKAMFLAEHAMLKCVDEDPALIQSTDRNEQPVYKPLFPNLP
jgi:hypothetical protein